MTARFLGLLESLWSLCSFFLFDELFLGSTPCFFFAAWRESSNKLSFKHEEDHYTYSSFYFCNVYCWQKQPKCIALFSQSNSTVSWVQSRIVKLVSFVHFVLQSLCPIQKSLSLPGLKQLNPFRWSHFGSCVRYIVFHPFVFHFISHFIPACLPLIPCLIRSALRCGGVAKESLARRCSGWAQSCCCCDNHRTLSSAYAHDGVSQCSFGSTLLSEVTHPFASFRSQKKRMSRLETWTAWDSGPLIWLSLLP